MQITDGEQASPDMRMPSMLSDDEDLDLDHDPERADLETQVSDDGVEQLPSDASDEDKDEESVGSGEVEVVAKQS